MTTGPPSSSMAPSGLALTSAVTARAGRAPHVMVLMMENESFGDIMGSPTASYETKLSKQYETVRNAYAVGHYSLDNYLAILSGRFYSWSTGDCTPGPGCAGHGPTLVSQLNHAHVSWRAFMGSMPKNCDRRNYTRGTVDASYGVRHDPFVYFPRIVHTACDHVQPASMLIGELNGVTPPDFVWLSPDICQDGGRDLTCSTVAHGDAYLSTEIPKIQATRWYAEGGVIVLAYDEGDGGGQGQGEYLHGAGNHIPMIVISAATKHRHSDTSYVNDFGLLAGIERAFRLPCLKRACHSANGLLMLPVPKQRAATG